MQASRNLGWFAKLCDDKKYLLTDLQKFMFVKIFIFSAWEDDAAEEPNVFDIFDEELAAGALWCF